METLSAWKWDAGMEVTLKEDDKTKRIIVEPKKP